MSEVKDMGLLQTMKAQHAAFLQQRDQTQVNFQQLVGAIFALETLIKQHEEKLIAELREKVEGTPSCETEVPDTLGDESNGKVDSESTESCSEE